MSDRRLPTRAEALDFLLDAGCSQGVINHCKTVSKFAVRLARAFQAKGFDVDVHLVEVSALLHDIGRSETHTVDHGLVGGQIARSLNLPISMVRIIERHVGGGITREEARQLGWPSRNYLPQTIEEKIVCYADKRVEGLKVVSLQRALRVYIERLGEKHPAIDRIRKLHEEMMAQVGDVK